jgi:hypothetical protein
MGVSKELKNHEIYAELLRRSKQGKIIIKSIKRKSAYGLGQVKVVAIIDKKNNLLFTVHPTEGVFFFVDGKQTF